MTLPDWHVDVRAVVIAAMDDEAAPFLDRASAVSDADTFGRAEHRIVTINGADLLLVRSGIGLVNGAAAATEGLLRTRPVHPGAVHPLVISAGSAGGIGPEVSVGDVVVGSSHVNAGADARAFGYAFGQTPRMPASYPGDPAALAAASSVAASSSPVLDGAGSRIAVRQGLIASSDSFIAGGEAVARIRAEFPQVLASEMESLAIAQVCSSAGAPFVAVRGISDLADPEASGAFRIHVDDAADRSARVVLALLAAL